MTRRSLVTVAALGSFALLLGAFVFQSLGYAPCKLCIWQRWPHGAAIAFGALFAFLPLGLLAIGGALSALTTAGIGLYHTGVERKWWEGPQSCSGGGGLDLGSMTGAQLLDPNAPTGVVMCDEVAWQMLGLSMASWNAVLSLGLLVLWIAAYRAPSAK